MRGSLSRLIRNELRIEWRELTSQRGNGVTLLLGVVIMLGVHFLWFQLLGLVRPMLLPKIAPEAGLLAGILLVALVPFGLTIGINQSVKAIFERNDLDLLLASPIASSIVFASRLLSVAAYVFVSLGLLLIPLGVVGVIMGVPRLLGVIPVLVVVAMVGATLGMLITLLLVRLFGARLARTVSQILAAVGGVFLVLAIQLPTLLSGSQSQALQVNRLLQLLQPGELLGVDSLIWFPGRALFLEPLPTIFMLALAALLFCVTVAVLHRWFILGASASTTVVRRRRPDSGRGLRFARRAGVWRVMLAKDWRSLIRDPYLVSQSLLQLAYLLPLAIILFIDTTLLEQVPLASIIATGLTVLAGTLSSNLARISMTGEEAIDLLIAAPVPPTTLRRAKMLSALIPVWLAFLPVAAAIVVLDVAAAAVAIIAILVATSAVTFSRLQSPRRSRRQDLFNRKNQSDPWLFIETLIPLAFGLATWWLLAGSTNAYIAAAIGVALPAFAWWRGSLLGAGYAAAGRS